MSDIIQLLPDTVANQIAAGEVIQRPASVVKELVENSVDAGATHVDVLITDAGRTSVRVVDDGKGMSETDARLSFERHATSKIRKADDLFALQTMGFRGEALASIAAVAQIELKTRQPNEDVGTQLSISGGRFVDQQPCACPVGCDMSVGNLFYNVPVRRKFLKSNATELNNVIAAFERIVLVYPQIAFRLYSNEAELFGLKPGSLRQRIVDVFGKRLNQDLLPLDVDTTMCKLSGFVGKPESARKKGAKQFFFVNGRYMKHPYFHKAVMTAYERLLPVGEQIPYFIYLEVPAEDIDVNIHPTKTEIKFENEQAIWQILMAAVKEAVGMFNDVPAIDFDTEGRPDIPVFDPSAHTSAPQVRYNPSYNPFNTSSSYKPASNAPKDWEQLYDGVRPEGETADGIIFSELGKTEGGEADDLDEIPGLASSLDEKSPLHYQYKGQYVLTSVQSGLMVIEQHRAHVRILYEDYLKRLANRTMDLQRELFPSLLQLTAAEALTLRHIMPELSDFGFELTEMGGDSFAINAVPAGLDGLQPSAVIRDMLESASSCASEVRDDINRSLALSMAQNAAIPVGQVLNNDEMEHLVARLFACDNVNYTPDSRKIFAIFPHADIVKLLG